jgi:group I intron endonuclease
MPICCALLLYGYSSFSLGILEYCAPSDILEREKYYFKLLNPEYNICSEPGAPMLGRNHSEETKDKFRNREHSEETKALMSAYRKISSIGKESPMLGKKHSDETKAKMSLSQKGHKGSIQPNAKKIRVTDLKTNSSTDYASMNEAAKVLSCPDSSILKNLKSKKGKPYKGRYVFELL